MSKTAQLASGIADARPRVIAALAAQLRDLELAEDVFADAAEALLASETVPDRPAAWLFTAAKRKAIDAIRRREAETRAADADRLLSDDKERQMGEIIQLPDPIPDERLRLMFICCHPAIALEARVALSLKVICGLPVPEIAKVFLTGEATMFQRITRSKRKVAEAGIAFELPPRRHWGERLDAVLLTLELAYTIAYQDAAGTRAEIDDGALGEEVARLARMVAELLPQEPEALGLAALVLLAQSRANSRLDESGAMVPLSQQDVKRWDLAQVSEARGLLDAAAKFGKTGPYQVMAAIQLTHARHGFDGETDWGAIAQLYDALLVLRPGPMVALNRAVAIGKADGGAAGLLALEAIEAKHLANVRPYHIARAELLAETGKIEAAKAALIEALALDPPSAERLFLEAKLAAL
ncbi:MAG: DUF6596 domain-containing protein [Pseudomonadota bacterium]